MGDPINVSTRYHELKLTKLLPNLEISPISLFGVSLFSLNKTRQTPIRFNIKIQKKKSMQLEEKLNQLALNIAKATFNKAKFLNDIKIQSPLAYVSKYLKVGKSLILTFAAESNGCIIESFCPRSLIESANEFIDVMESIIETKPLYPITQAAIYPSEQEACIAHTVKGNCLYIEFSLFVPEKEQYSPISLKLRTPQKEFGFANQKLYRMIQEFNNINSQNLIKTLTGGSYYIFFIPPLYIESNDYPNTVDIELQCKDKNGNMSVFSLNLPTKTDVDMDLIAPVLGKYFVGGLFDRGHKHMSAIHDSINGFPLLPQKYSIDFVPLETGTNPDVLAPADGTIVRTLDGIRDKKLRMGDFPPITLVGNHAIIDHSNNRYSLFAHLKNKSLKVELGDRVKQGDVIGKMGSSGLSSGTHLHYQYMDNPDPYYARGIPTLFKNMRSENNELGFFPLNGEIVTCE